MELYFAPFACSLASHIVLREAGLDATLVRVELSTKRTADGADFLAVAPKGQVPTLRLTDGAVLTESGAVLQYLAECNGGTALMPAVGTPERYRVLEWLSFIGTEIHKACFAPMFDPEAPAEAKAWARGRLDKKLAYVAGAVGDRPFLVGDRFTVADAYLTWVLTLCGPVGVELPEALVRYRERMHARPAVQTAIAEETTARS